MPLNAAEFAQQTSSLELIDETELSSILAELSPAQRDDVQSAARLLVERGKLTKYQAAAIFQEKGKSLIYGDYVVLDRIGAGGMGVVFKARHRRMDRIVALKVIAAAALKNADAVKRFEREVKAAAKLVHPNIVIAHDAGQEDGQHYLVMEYVDGADLSTLLKRQGRFPVRQVCDYVVQAARGLAFAHAKGVVHRDIKPGNLLVGTDGVVKILDLGLARMDDQAGASPSKARSELTQQGEVMGTVDYMAPEQAADTRRADAKSNVYSLGCTLYRLFTGDTPYHGETVVERILAHTTKPIPSPRQARPDVPSHVDALCRRMLAKEPSERPTMQEVADALATSNAADAGKSGVITAGAGSQVRTPPPVAKHDPASSTVPRGMALPTATTIQKAATSQAVAPPPKSKSPLVIASGVAAALIGGGIWFITQNQDRPEDAPQAAAVVAQAPAPSPTVRTVAVSSTATVAPAPIATPTPTPASAPPAATPTSSAAVAAAPSRVASPSPSAADSIAQATPTVATPLATPAATVAALPSSIPPPRPVPATPGTLLELTLGRDVPLRFRSIPSGTFLMGSPANENGRRADETPHEVKLTRRFYLGETEITNAQWRAVGTQLSRTEVLDVDMPRNIVSWETASAYIGKLNQSPLGKAYRFRLPTEAEWEFACRAGTSTTWFFGNDPSVFTQYAWGRDNGREPHPVAQLKPNPWGLYDLYGNVMEWCFDFYATDYQIGSPLTDPRGPPSGDKHVLRGNAFNATAPTTRCGGHRVAGEGGWASYGFRVVCEPILDGVAPLAESTSSRRPIPEAAQRQKALADVKDIYKADYVVAKSPEQKSALAMKFVEQARQSAGEPTSEYVLLDEARRLAIDGGNLAAIREVLTLLNRDFDVEESTTLLEGWNELLRRPRVDPATIKILYEEAAGLFDEAVVDGRFDDAKSYGDFALLTARRQPNSAAIVKFATDRNTALTARQKEWNSISAAADTLSTAPDDAAANLIVGRYQALVVGDWRGALPLLAKTGDETLRRLAEQSLTADDPATLAAAGDAWYDAAQTAKPPLKSELLTGANYFYVQAAPALQGLPKARVDKRLTETTAAVPPRTIPATKLPFQAFASGSPPPTSIVAVPSTPATPTAPITAPKSAATTTARPTAIKGPLNLLGLINLSRDVIHGKWNNVNGALVGGGGNTARMVIPLTPPDEYDLTLIGQLTGGQNTPGMMLGFVAGGKQSYIYLCPDRSGIGIRGISNNKYLVTGKNYPVKQPYQLVCSVRKESVTATLNGETIVDYKEDLTAFGLGPGLAMPPKDQLFLAIGADAQWTISSLVLSPVLGAKK